MSGIPTLDGAAYLWNLFGAGELTVPNYFVALINTVQPGSAALGTELDEPPFSDYARAAYPNISGNWFIQNGLLTNQNEIAFPTPIEDWGVINFWALCDSDSSGRVLFVGDVDDLTVTSGVQPILSPGSLILNIALPTFQVHQ